MIVLIVVFSILALFAFYVSIAWIKDKNIDTTAGVGMMIISLGFLFSGLLSFYEYSQKRIAMDENRQKYEKVIYYESVNGKYVATDSTVVLKD